LSCEAASSPLQCFVICRRDLHLVLGVMGSSQQASRLLYSFRHVLSNESIAALSGSASKGLAQANPSSTGSAGQIVSAPCAARSMLNSSSFTNKTAYIRCLSCNAVASVPEAVQQRPGSATVGSTSAAVHMQSAQQYRCSVVWHCSPEVDVYSCCRRRSSISREGSSTGETLWL
jgi:hypothetical protein